MSHAQSGIPEHAPSWWSLALRGLVAVLFGLAALFWPDLVLEVLILLFGAYALVDGVFALIAAFGSSGRGMRRPLLLIEGVSASCSELSLFFGLVSPPLHYSTSSPSGPSLAALPG
jgi:uncharacterized membrane protein HdeD (DUF308 family)